MENFNLTIHGVTNMPNLSASEKLCMIHLYTLKSIGVNVSHVVVSSTMLGYTRHGYLKIINRLKELGYVKHAEKRGYYSLTNTNIF